MAAEQNEPSKALIRNQPCSFKPARLLAAQAGLPLPGVPGWHCHICSHLMSSDSMPRSGLALSDHRHSHPGGAQECTGGCGLRTSGWAGTQCPTFQRTALLRPHRDPCEQLKALHLDLGELQSPVQGTALCLEGQGAHRGRLCTCSPQAPSYLAPSEAVVQAELA